MQISTESYLGIPYLDHGRDRAGCDCWGLVRLVYREQLGIWLPSYSAEYHSADDLEAELLAGREDLLEDWTSLEHPEPGAVGWFELGSLFHVGVCLDRYGREMLHIMRGREVCIEKVASAAWRQRLKGWYRYAAG